MIQNLAMMRSGSGDLFVRFGLLPYAYFIFSRFGFWLSLNSSVHAG